MGEVALPLLAVVARAIEGVGLECIVVGNSAAALQGAPVTTIDIDFMFRKTAKNIEKLRRLAQALGGHLSQPFLPASEMYRLITENLQVDFVSRMDGIRSFESLRSRAADIDVGGVSLCIASLEDVIKSKRAAGREKDLASLPILEKTLAVKKALSEADRGSALDA
jgi:predicted nucleotidyltransferase